MGEDAYNFAKTPLKAAHAPLNAASGSQGILPALGICRSWDDGGTVSGSSGST